MNVPVLFERMFTVFLRKYLNMYVVYCLQFDVCDKFHLYLLILFPC